MATFHCDATNGNDTTGDGSSGTPYATIQKCVDNMTGGDTCKVANTSAQVLSAQISWSSGWTADNTKVTVFESWDNGGSITIQRPDEASARTGATIDCNNAVSQAFATTSQPQNVCYRNLKIINSTSYGLKIDQFYHTVFGCEFDGTANTNDVEVRNNIASVVYNYFHGATSTGFVDIQRSSFLYNYIDGSTATGTSRALVEGTSGYDTIVGNTFILNTDNKEALSVLGSSNHIVENTFVGSGGTGEIGITTTGTYDTIMNNVFYHFDGTSALPIEFGASVVVFNLGYNGLFDCNSYTPPTKTINDLTGNDVTGSGDPFVDSASDDYSVAGSTLANAALGAGG